VQVPVFCTRHVLVNFSPTLTVLLSGTVTSLTNFAALVQSTAFCGGGRVTVGVGVGVSCGGSVAVAVSVGIASVGVEVSATGEGVDVRVVTAVELAATSGAAEPLLQAERKTVTLNKTSKRIFFDIKSSFF
jgi:hypothetical protein